MKTRRIILFIELVLFILGIVAAYYFAINDDGKDKIFSVISNICIGISTGGLVAFLIEIPQYYSNCKNIKKELYFNFSMAYIYITSLIKKIDDICKNDNDIVYEDFCTYHLKYIEKHSNIITKIDKFVYHAKVKQNFIEDFIQIIMQFLISKDTFDNVLKIKIHELQRKQLELLQPQINPQSSMVLSELCEIKNKLEFLKTHFDVTANIIFDGKDASVWQKLKNKIHEK